MLLICVAAHDVYSAVVVMELVLVTHYMDGVPGSVVAGS